MLLDDTPNRFSSDAGNQDIVSQTDDVLFSDEASASKSTGTQATQTVTKTAAPARKDRKSLIEEAKRQTKRGAAAARNTIPKALGEATGDKFRFYQRRGKNAQMAGPMAGQEAAKEKEDSKEKKKGIFSQLNDLTRQVNDKGQQSQMNPLGLKDPRKMIAGVADESLHIGKKLGHILFVIWEASAAISWIPFIITGIPGLLMLNLLLISPKWCYKITVAILWLVGAGEAISTANKFGLDQVKIEISPLEKYAIVVTDILYFFAFLILAAFILSISCWALGGFGGTLASWLDKTGFVSTLKNFCPNVPK